MVYTIGGKKEYGGPLSEGKRIRKAGLVENLGYRVLEILNGDKQDFSGVTHGGSVWPTFEAAKAFLDTAPNDGTPPDVNPTTHAVYAVDANWDDDTYQVNGVEWRSLFYSAEILPSDDS